jgi:hypothetical protein
MNNRLEFNNEVSNNLILFFKKFLVSGCHRIDLRLYDRSIRVY